MHRSRLSQLPDDVLLETLKSLLARDRLHSAELVAHLAEVDRRKLYRPAGYPSMYVYCVHELHMSEAVAYKRIRAARVVRRFPFVLHFISDGRLHLDAIKRLAPKLNERNVRELVESASHRTSREVELLIAERFPKPDAPTVLRPLLPPSTLRPSAEASAGEASAELGAGEATLSPESGNTETAQLAARPVVNSAPVGSERGVGLSAAPEPRPSRVAPLSPGRFVLQVTLDQHTHDLLQRAKELFAAAQPGCEVAQVLERALSELVERLEQQKFGDTDAPRERKATCDTRHIPAKVKRQVAERDDKRCTFVSDQGTRCPERALLEYDHVRPMALGGRSTVENLRLRCRAHNQFEAELLYGEAFMQQKRDERRAAADRIREVPIAYRCSDTHRQPSRAPRHGRSWRRGACIPRGTTATFAWIAQLHVAAGRNDEWHGEEPPRPSPGWPSSTSRPVGTTSGTERNHRDLRRDRPAPRRGRSWRRGASVRRGAAQGAQPRMAERPKRRVSRRQDAGGSRPLRTDAPRRHEPGLAHS